MKIELALARGVLKPASKGFREHPRALGGRTLPRAHAHLLLHNGGAEDVYLASADWMDRNFFRRIELCFPVLDAALKRRVIREGLQPYLDDNCQAWVMNADGGLRGACAALRRAALGTGRIAIHARDTNLESPHKGKTGLRRVLNAAHYSLSGLAAAARHEDAFRQELILVALLTLAALGLATRASSAP